MSGYQFLGLQRVLFVSPNQKRHTLKKKEEEKKRHTCEMSCTHQVQLNFIWEIKRKYIVNITQKLAERYKQDILADL